MTHVGCAMAGVAVVADAPDAVSRTIPPARIAPANNTRIQPRDAPSPPSCFGSTHPLTGSAGGLKGAPSRAVRWHPQRGVGHPGMLSSQLGGHDLLCRRNLSASHLPFLKRRIQAEAPVGRSHRSRGGEVGQTDEPPDPDPATAPRRPPGRSRIRGAGRGKFGAPAPDAGSRPDSGRAMRPHPEKDGSIHDRQPFDVGSHHVGQLARRSSSLRRVASGEMARLSSGCRQWQAIWWRTRGCRSPVVSGVSSLPTAVGTRLPSLAVALVGETAWAPRGPRRGSRRRGA